MSISIQEAIEVLKILPTPYPNETMDTAKIMGINALNKQVPKLVSNLEYAVDVYGDCPRCGTNFHLDRNEVEDVNYCIKCGQRLDWNLGL